MCVQAALRSVATLICVFVTPGHAQTATVACAAGPECLAKCTTSDLDCTQPGDSGFCTSVIKSFSDVYDCCRIDCVGSESTPAASSPTFTDCELSELLFLMERAYQEFLRVRKLEELCAGNLWWVSRQAYLECLFDCDPTSIPNASDQDPFKNLTREQRKCLKAKFIGTLSPTASCCPTDPPQTHPTPPGYGYPPENDRDRYPDPGFLPWDPNGLGDNRGGGMGPSRMGPVDQGRGVVVHSEVDLALPSPGFSWIIGRSLGMNSADENDDYLVATETEQGWNWVQGMEASVAFHDEWVPSNDLMGESFPMQASVRYGSTGGMEFYLRQPGEFAGRGDSFFTDKWAVYQPTEGAQGLLLVEHGADADEDDGTLPVVKYIDDEGTQVYFFHPTDADATDLGLGGRLWKIVDAGGNTAWIGHPTNAATAAEAGYETDFEELGHLAVKFAVDPGDRRYTYTYTGAGTYGTVLDRLTQVKVEKKTGGTWEGFPTGASEVARVNYAYYTAATTSTASEPMGQAGDLKSVTVTMPTSLSSSYDHETSKHYRYYDSTTFPHMLKMVVGPEGVRRRGTNVNSDADATLKPYAEQFLVYKGNIPGQSVDQSDPRVHSMFQDGECGCGGAIDGVIEFEYEANSHFDDASSASYDPLDWFTRTIVRRPDATYVTTYMDDRYRELMVVVTDIDPDTSFTESWVTRYERDDVHGHIVETHTPAANTGYDHEVTVSKNPLTSVTSTSKGLVLVHEFEDVVDEGPLLIARRWKTHDGSTTENLLSSREYGARVWEPFSTDYPMVRVNNTFVSAMWSYHDEGKTTRSDISAQTGSHKTSVVRTWWGSTVTSSDYFREKSIEVELPAIATSKNGSNSSNESVSYFKKDGRLVFSEDEIGILDYTAYDVVTGMPRYTVTDADTSWTAPGGSGLTDLGSALSADVSEFGVSSTGGLKSHNVTEYRYDDQGRTIEADLNAGSDEERTVKAVYGKLYDNRLYVISIPKVDGATYYGPASFTVMNLAGSVEEQGTLDLGAATITNSPTIAPGGYWIDPTETAAVGDNTDILAAIDQGSAASLSTTQYDDLGTRPESSRLYHDIPASGTGSSGTNYDETTYDYDDMSRVTKVTDPTGTISESVYDTLGRVEASKIGTSGANMTTVREIEYDDGNDGGNSYVTEQTLIVDENTSADDRVTEFYHDVRGRVTVAMPPEAPYSYSVYNNIGNVLESSTWDSTSTLNSSAEPPTLSGTGRLSLSEMSYDELARPYQSKRFILTAAGAKDGNSTHLISKTWYDQRGLVAKSLGASISKTLYDRLGRGVFRAVLIGDNDTDYDDAVTIVSDQDVIASQSETIYDPLDGLIIMSVSMERHHDLADTVYGVLGQRVTIAASTAISVDPTDYEDHGRLSVSATFYDALDRPQHSVAHGLPDATVTRKDSSWDHSAVPTREDDGPLVMSTTYGDDGRVTETADTLNRKTAMTFDHASRVVLQIENKTASPTLTTEGRDTDRYVRTKYEDGLLTHLWIDMQGDDTNGEPPSTFTGADVNDQVTEYDYGVTKGTTSGTSRIQSNRLLAEVTYPDSTGATDTVTYAYNAQGQEIFREDQTESEIVTTYDELGRPTEKDATLGGSSGFDASVDKIKWTYNERGLTESVQQLNSSSTVLDEVRMTYTTLNELENLHQDFDSAWTAMGNHKTVEFEYGLAQADGAFASSFRHRRRVGHNVHDTNELEIEYSYGSASSRDDLLGRVASVSYEGLTVTSYEYNGMASVVGTVLDEVDLSCYRYDPDGGDPSDLTRLDRFSRVYNDVWSRTISGTSTEREFYDVTVEFRRGASIENVRDAIHTSWTYDYTNDGFDRITAAPKGTWTGGDELATSGAGSLNTTVSDETFALSQTGNWLTHKIDLDNDSTFETNSTGTFNRANEATAYTGTPAATPVYDPVGNLTDSGEVYTYVYDVWGRLRSVSDAESDNVIAEYVYNGMGYKIGERHDEDASGDLDNDDPWERHLYDDRWRIIATYTAEYDTSSYVTEDDPTELFVYHAAGINGNGSYIDAAILRERDATPTRDGTLEQRVYFIHNWRGDVVSLWQPNALGTSVHVLDVRYDPYGLPTTLPRGDVADDFGAAGADGQVSFGDFSLMSSKIGGPYDAKYDLNYDNAVDSDDILLLLGYIGSAGRGVLGYTNASGTNVTVIDRGYSGAIHDRWLADTNGDMTFVHMRHRHYDASRGRWTRRDPIGYHDGPSLYQYTRGSPVYYVDPEGLCAATPDNVLKSAHIAFTALQATMKPRQAALALAAMFGICVATEVTGFDPEWFRRNTTPTIPYPARPARPARPTPAPDAPPTQRPRPRDEHEPRRHPGRDGQPSPKPSPQPTPTPRRWPAPIPLQPYDPSSEDLEIPGDCTQKRYDDLVKLQGKYCSTPGCKKNKDYCTEMAIKALLLQRCCDARRQIMDECFRGGDERHRKHHEEVCMEAVRRCRQLIEEGRCKQDDDNAPPIEFPEPYAPPPIGSSAGHV